MLIIKCIIYMYSTISYNIYNNIYNHNALYGLMKFYLKKLSII